MKYRLLKKRHLKPKPLTERNAVPNGSSDNNLGATYSALELEAAAALLMLRYQYDIKSAKSKTETTVDSTITETSRSPTPPPPCPTDNCTPKDQPIRMTASSQPLKKRSIPAHLLRRSLTPGKQGSQNQIQNQNAIVKPKVKAKTPLPCARSDNKTDNKALLKSCRNMIREFLDNQEKI